MSEKTASLTRTATAGNKAPAREVLRVDPHAAVIAHERPRDFLVAHEVAALIEAARRGRHGVRDALAVSLMFRHGLRASELAGLRVSDVNLNEGRLWVRRLKNGLATEQPIADDDLRRLKRWLCERDSALPWLFVNERGEPMTRNGVYYIVKAAAARAGEIAVPVHPHTLRHATGHALANAGRDLRLIQDYLGHRDPKNTMRYTQTSAARFVDIFERAK